MSEYCLFQPGEYMDFEKEEVQLRWDIYHGKRTMPGPPGMPPMDPDDEDSLPPFMRPRRYTEEEIIAYNKKWNPYDPLYNDPAYARAHGHPSVPAYPGFEAMPPIMVVPQFPKDMASRFYYTNDGTDIHYNRNIYAGDLLRETNVKKFFEERTHPNDELRRWCMGGEADKVDESGKVVMHLSGSVREYYRQLLDDSKRPTFSENQESWTKYAPSGHYTTDADYERMKEIWDQEKIMGDDTPFWEDVPVGFELPKTCSDGPVTYMHMMYWYDIGDLSIYSREELMDPKMRAVTFRDRYGAFLDETALHFGNRNINTDGARGVWYNDTGARLIARTLTDFVGNKGRVSRFSWRFFPFFQELRDWDMCKAEFMKVPGMEGRDCDRHGSQGDTCIGRAVVTDKYINDQGEHCCEVMLWGEDLEGNIVQGCPSEIVLPSKDGI